MNEPSDFADRRRRLLASASAHKRWAMEDDRSAATQPARDGLIRKFEREVDPEGKLAPQELAKRVENARKAYYKTLAAKSAIARARRKGGQR